MIKKNIFFEWYESKNKKTEKKLLLVWKVLFLLLFLSIFLWSLVTIAQNSLNYYGLENFIENIKDFFSFSNNSNYPGQNLWLISLQLIWKTFQYVLLGSIFGFLLALFTGFLASSLLKNKIYFLFKILIIFLKALPIWIFLYAFQISLSRDLAATAIILWFSWLWNHKYIIEIFDNNKFDSYYQKIKKGQNRFVVFITEVIPRVNNKLLTLFFYSLESNILWTTILSSLGLLGIGQLIDSTYANNLVGIKALAIPLFSLFAFLLFFELLIFYFNKYLFKQKTIKKIKYPDWHWKKIVKIFFLLLTIALVIYSLINLEWSSFNEEAFRAFFNKLIHPIFKITDFNFGKAILELFQAAIVIIVFSVILGFLFSLLFNENLNKKRVYWNFKVLSTFMRLFPTVALIFIFAPLFSLHHTFLICLIMIFNVSATFAKQFSEMINNINWAIYRNLKKQNYSYFFIVKNFIYPSIKKEMWKNIIFKFENILRNFIFLGAYGGSLIGYKLNIFLETGPTYNIQAFGGIVLILFIIFFLIEFFSTWEFQKFIKNLWRAIKHKKINLIYN
ncbi:hypothetical protein NV226_00050 [Mycoplasma iguanae]|uniref:ABC transmembrane type-1 domain-containing protein n=1 Tax=Mycoplasma iguanae TaxID=292461 RepID=A0ABY5R8R1_9MOLU|nr:hypothetical protein [Mycoplasma iguanae]UVD81701.1 hypothetical protein NV226_00050 [Mycoplasma iguanae]